MINDDSKEIELTPPCCGCSKKHCLARYCDCFKLGKQCLKCNYKDCKNNHNHNEERLKKMESIKAIDPDAFEVKNTTRTNQFRRIAGNVLSCNCKTTKCMKNYCPCKKEGVGCSKNCECKHCRNKKASFKLKKGI